MKCYICLFLTLSILLFSCSSKTQYTPGPPQSISFDSGEDPEAALITFALERALHGWHFKYELEEMRKRKEIYVQNIRVQFHPDNPYGMGHPDEILIDTTALPQLLPIRGYQTHVISEQTYHSLLKTKKTRSLLQIGTLDMQGDSASVVVFVLAICQETKTPSICMAGGAIHYQFQRKSNQWHFDRIRSHLQS